MRKLIATIILGMTGLLAQAAPGDTTKVQAHSDIWMDHFGNFDSTVEFPDGTTSYRKVMMTFTLGRYACPPTGNPPQAPQYCGDWDYTIRTVLMTKSGDTIELGRLISPYAGDGWPRTSVSWKQRYEFDVTDYYPLLKDTATVRIHYSGYSWGFTGNVKFDFIEGTPPRNVVGIDQLWQKSYRFGDTAGIDSRVTSYTKTAPTGTQYTDMKFIITGHGSDDNGCSEFCKKYYTVVLNKALGQQVEMWRDDCGYNHMYPQNGTWIYNRGNWCPGDKVFENVHPLGVTGGSTYEIDVDFENYLGSITRQGASWGSYIIGAAAFYYGAFNKNLDAELEDVIAPSNHETHFRQNPMTGRPLVKIRNTGATTITSVKFKYEMSGGTGAQEYTWQGSLESLQSIDVEFPPFHDLFLAKSSGNTFTVEIVAVNGTADDDATNNKRMTEFSPAMKMSTTFILEMKTNAATTGGVSETSWKVIDLFNNFVMAERKNCASNTTYVDTVKLVKGMYKIEVSDVGCDGLNWWANPNAGSGYIYLKGAVSPIPIPMTGYFSADFGCGFSQYINVDWPTDVEEVVYAQPGIDAYPNPAQNTLNVNLKGIDNVNGTLQLKDMTGKVVKQAITSKVNEKIDVSGIANGIYVIEFTGSELNGKVQTKVTIAR